MSNPDPVVTPIRPDRPSEEIDRVNPYLELLEKQKQAFLDRGISNLKQRKDALTKLSKALAKYSDDIITAVQEDFGHRSPHETILTEVLASQGEAALTKAKLKGWMKPHRAPSSISALPATGKIVYQPKGVIGIMGAWNYPAFLCFSPLIGVMAAGNHAMIKPPDVTPRTSEVIKDLIASTFDEEYIAVVTGEVQAAVDFSELPFDHLMYTGNTEIGRRVMMAAAKNLTPVTLEMGGKSPTIISEDYSIKRAVARIMMGKCVNSGQTCIAPDYIMLKEGKEDEFAQAWSDAVSKRYPTVADNQDITWIVNERHYQRVLSLIEDAREKGATIHQINPKNEEIPEGKRVIPHTVITNTTEDMRCMQEEIFGPVLPVKTYKTIDEAIRYVNERPRPLALYYFQNNKKKADEMIQRTISGGACLNETMLHIAHQNMPFGGSGDSGVGGYHGFDGFVQFSHKKAVLYQLRAFSPAAMLKGPYPKVAEGVLRRVTKMLG